MKKLYVILFCFLLTATSFSQKKYFRSSGEYIFGFSDISNANAKIDSKMRFSFFFHLGEYFNYDINNIVGFYSGLGIRNIGFITSENNTVTKRRSYTAGIPFALKLGNLENNTFIFGGGEYEYLFHYKEKTYSDQGKSIHKKWFSEKTNALLPSVFAGIQFSNGLNLKFKYYLQNFMNVNYSEKIDNQIIKPYNNLKSQLFSISLSFNFNKYRIKDFRELNPIKKESKSIEV